MPNKQNKYAEVLAGMRPPEGLSKEQAWEQLQAKLAQTPEVETPVVQMASRRVWWSAAAAVAVLAVASFMFFPSGGDIAQESHVAAQAPQTVTLPDGSVVTLNDFASVTFSPSTWEENRELTLSGEAFFQVQKGSKFTVVSESGTVQVLGTSFNVNTDAGAFEVDCFTGKVAVRHDAQEVVLTPGQRSSMDQGQLSKNDFDPASNNWQAGVFHFTDCTLGHMCASLGKAYNTSIDASAVANQTMDIDVNTNEQTLQEVLQAVCGVKGLSQKVSGNTIVLQSK